MRDYAKVAPHFWIGDTGRKLRVSLDAQLVALYLVSSPHSNALGLYYLPLPLLAHETGLGPEGASKGLRSCIEAGFCDFDEAAEVVWVFEMARFQVGTHLKESDKRCAWLRSEYAALPANRFLGGFFDRYQEDFHLGEPRGGPRGPEAHRRGIEAPCKPHRSQEQEQEQEQERPPTPRRGTRAEDPRFEEFYGAFPVQAKRQDAAKVWGSLAEAERGAALEAVLVYADVWRRAPGDRLAFAGYAATWLRGKRWGESRETWERAAAPRSTGSRNGRFVEPGFASEGPGFDEIPVEVLS